MSHLSVFLPSAFAADVVDLAVEHLVGAGVDLGVDGLLDEHLHAGDFWKGKKMQKECTSQTHDVRRVT